MPKIIKLLTVALIIAVALFIIITFIPKIIRNIHNNNIENPEWIAKNTNIVLDKSLGENIYSVSKDPDINIYDLKYQNIINEKLANLDTSDDFKNPLIIYNLYGSNEASLDIYFATKEASYLEYSVQTSNTTPFQKTLKNDGQNNLTTTHAYQLIGLILETENTINLTLKNKSNEIIDTYSFTIDLSNIKAASEIKLEITEGESKEELSNGLYTILGNDSDEQDYVFMYDNDGYLRSQIPIIGYRAHALLFQDDKTYFSISQTQIAQMNNLGEITDIFDTGYYQLHHDYTFNQDGDLLILANNTKKDTEEDCIIKIDIESKKITEVIDFEDMFQSYVDTCTLDTKSTRDEGEDGLDWLHLNSIEYIDKDVILSSRETSSIIKISNLETTPEIKYILADKSIWENTEFANYVYDQKSNFKVQAGQHSVRLKEKINDYQYYLILYDNNYGKSNSQPNIDYKQIGIPNTKSPYEGSNSYYYVYLVDEKNKTFDLVNSIEVPYSGIVSSVQIKDNNIIIDSGTKGIFGEYDSNNNLIRQFKTKMNKYMVYRVYKYDFNNFYFIN